ncbi:MAG: hypothetical protein WAU84_05195, partial [Thermoguttaceae bacterium]
AKWGNPLECQPIRCGNPARRYVCWIDLPSVGVPPISEVAGGTPSLCFRRSWGGISADPKRLPSNDFVEKKSPRLRQSSSA